MNSKRIHQFADLSNSLYRICYTSMLLYYLFRRKNSDPPPLPPDTRRTYH